MKQSQEKRLNKYAALENGMNAFIYSIRKTHHSFYNFYYGEVIIKKEKSIIYLPMLWDMEKKAINLYKWNSPLYDNIKQYNIKEIDT